MKSFKILLAASVLALSTSAAFAQGVGTWSDQSQQQQSGGVGSQILNSQINLQTNWSNLTGSVDTVGGDVVVQGNAAGNLVDVTTMNDTRVANTNQAICNGASVSTDPILTSVKSNQACHATDPYSEINTNISNIGGNAIVQGVSVGNKLETDSNAPNFPVISRQLNNSGVVSNVNANVFNAAGTVGLSSSAVGNSSQIIHYSTN